MVREILFRGKTKNRQNNEWIYGSLVRGIRKYDSNPTLFIYSLDTEMDGRGWIGNYYGEEVDPETVGQWTGLVDKNGVKIFEGDVVRYKHTFEFRSSETLYEHINDEPECVYEYKGDVKYSDGKFMPIPYRYDCDDYFYSHADFDFEVIGNIHDNPELVN